MSVLNEFKINMKRIFALLMIVLAVAAVVSSSYIKERIFPEKAVSKNINIRILQGILMDTARILIAQQSWQSLLSAEETSIWTHC